MTKAGNVNIVSRIPTLAEFRELRSNAGWENPPDVALQRGLNNTIYAVCAENEDKLAIGIGRIVGDGGVQFFITDVIVHKDWQRREIGSRILGALMKHIEDNIRYPVFINLFTATGKHQLYEKFGFVARSSIKMGPGMIYMHKRSE